MARRPQAEDAGADQLAAEAARTAGAAARFAARISVGVAGAGEEPPPQELGQTADAIEAAGRELIAAAERLRLAVGLERPDA